MHPIENIIHKKSRKILGLMSGTSCDGLDMAIVEIQGHGIQTKFNFVLGGTAPYTPDQREGLLNLIKSSRVTSKTLSQLNFYLARIWSEMIEIFLSGHQIQKMDIDLIGCHGQTIWHQPESDDFIDRPVTSTMQLGDPSVLAQLVGIPVIGDFRVADVALGGQGAPLIPFFDWIYFSQFREDLLILNIGGISNMTYTPSDGEFNKVIAFDCGPGNMLIDQSMEHFYQKTFDKNGSVARTGKSSEELLSFLKNNDHFVQKAPPKSIGREHYNIDFFESIIRQSRFLKIQNADVIRTLTEYTSYAIYENYRKFILPNYKINKLVVGGGGWYNDFLVEILKKYFGDLEVLPVKKYKLNEAFKEAIGFAILANESILGFPSNVPQVTNASRPAVLGKICLV